MIKKRILSSDPDLLIIVYQMYVLPILSYCSPIWNPHTHENIIQIEKIQKSFTRTLAGYMDLSYNERLIKANLKSLELSRLHADMILCYKILHDLVDIDKYNILRYELSSRITRGHNLKLRAAKPNCGTYLFSYAYRVSKIWNNLSPNAVWAPTLGTFKQYLIGEDLSDFFIFYILNNIAIRFKFLT